MISVSDDALTAFERRGLPLRDAFDSSFDEIIQVRPLSYAESRRLLYRRVIGLAEPYVASAVRDLRLDFCAYAYYCATLQEVFADRLDSERMIQATSDSSGTEASNP